jgi:hypothetical protein
LKGKHRWLGLNDFLFRLILLLKPKKKLSVRLPARSHASHATQLR